MEFSHFLFLDREQVVTVLGPYSKSSPSRIKFFDIWKNNCHPVFVLFPCTLLGLLSFLFSLASCLLFSTSFPVFIAFEDAAFKEVMHCIIRYLHCDYSDVVYVLLAPFAQTYCNVQVHITV